MIDRSPILEAFGAGFWVQRVTREMSFDAGHIERDSAKHSELVRSFLVGRGQRCCDECNALSPTTPACRRTERVVILRIIAISMVLS